MPSLLAPTEPEIPASRKTVINVIVVCGTFCQLAYSLAFNDYSLPPHPASKLDYAYALEPVFSFLVIVTGVRGGWLAWSKEKYDRLKFPLSGAELLAFVGLYSGFCLLQQSALPIMPDATRVDWVTHAVLYLAALLALEWTIQQQRLPGGARRIWPVIWHALTVFMIGAELFLNINLANAVMTENVALGYIKSKFVTTSKYGRHTYHVDVTSPANPASIVSIPIDRATWDHKREGDAIRLRLFRGGLGQDYWRYER